VQTALALHYEQLCLTPERMIPGHRIVLLFGGADAYPVMLEAIASARSEVLLETYIWAADANGRRFVDAVCIKAQEGVTVRCVVDGAGSFGFVTGPDVERMRSAGVKLSVFHPVGPWRARWGWQVRDHRKLLVVDGRVAFAGGMNIGDDYAPTEWGGHGWNDVQVQIEGPAVREMQRHFDVSWRYSTPWTFERHHETRAMIPEPPAIHGSTTRVQPLAVGRFLGRRSIQRQLTHAIGAARDRIWIEAAYFLPNRTVRAYLRRAARRGVDVRVITPRDSDIPFFTYASQYTWATLLRAGVRLYEWLPGMLHAKTICIDGAWSTIGSYNLDSRSLLYNWEVTLAVLDAAVASRLEDKFQLDLEMSEPVDPARWRKRGLLQRLRERFFYFFRVWL
jgi:cardiolipin synthase